MKKQEIKFIEIPEYGIIEKEKIKELIKFEYKAPESKTEDYRIRTGNACLVFTNCRRRETVYAKLRELICKETITI